MNEDDKKCKNCKHWIRTNKRTRHGDCLLVDSMEPEKRGMAINADLDNHPLASADLVTDKEFYCILWEEIS